MKTKNNISKMASANSKACRLKSFNLIKLSLMKVKNVSTASNIQTKDVAITHFIFLMV